MWFVLIVIALTAVACATPSYEQILTFVATEPRLLRALYSARQQLLDNGVLLANEIHITNYGKGIPVNFAEGSEGDRELQKRCEQKHDDLNGCTRYRDWSYTPREMWLRENLDDDRLAVFVLHEMMHALFPGIQHLRPDQIGVFTLNSNSSTLTPDDLALIREYTEVSADT